MITKKKDEGEIQFENYEPIISDVGRWCLSQNIFIAGGIHRSRIIFIAGGRRSVYHDSFQLFGCESFLLREDENRCSGTRFDFLV